MKRFLTSIGLYLLFLGIFYVSLVYLWGNFAPYYLKKNLAFPLPGFMDRRLQQVDSVKNVDILFIGSSHAYRGFDPRIFSREGFYVFNLGSSSQTPIQSEYLIKRYMNQINPGLIVIEVYPEVFGLDGLESTIDILSNEIYSPRTLDIVFQANHPLAYNTYIYHGVKQLFGAPRHQQRGGFEFDKYVSGGFVETTSEARCCGEIGSKKWIFREDQLLAFDRILQLLLKNNRSFLMVRAPISRALTRSITNHKAVDSTLNRFGTIYDFGQSLPLTDSVHFYDPDHLNQKGVEIFNDSLVAVIKKHQKIP